MVPSTSPYDTRGCGLLLRLLDQPLDWPGAWEIVARAQVQQDRPGRAERFCPDALERRRLVDPNPPRAKGLSIAHEIDPPDLRRVAPAEGPSHSVIDHAQLAIGVDRQHD